LFQAIFLVLALALAVDPRMNAWQDCSRQGFCFISAEPCMVTAQQAAQTSVNKDLY
jgi:hypothetical protein